MSASGAARVRITVVDSAHAPLPDAYVALYAPDDSWRRPSHETIAANGIATFLAPAGRYQIFAGASGFQSAMQRFEVGETAQQTTITLAPDAHISGMISDEAGNPVRGARVSQVRIPLSDRARQHLTGRWTTVTDENGWWTLPAPSDFIVPLLIEASGFAPAWREARPSEKTQMLQVMLRRGAKLRVQLDHTDPALLVTLTTAGSEVPAGWQRQVWQRSAAARTLEWDALAPGTYRIIVESQDPARFVRTEAGSASATADPDTQQLALPRWSDMPVRTLFVTQKSPGELAAVTGWQRMRDGGVEMLPAATESASGGTLIHLATSADARDLFASTADHLIVPLESTTARSVTAAAHDRGEATLRIAAANESTAIPRAAEVTFRDCAGERTIRIVASIAKSGDIVVPAPADCRTLVLRAPPLEPLAVALAIRKRETKWLGAFRLAAAGEAEVRVRWTPSGMAAAGAAVRAVLPLEEGEAIVAEGVAGEDGVVVLQGLPAEKRVRVEARSERASSLGSSLISLAPGDRQLVDPLPLPEPAKLVVRPRLSARFRELYPDATVAALSLSPDYRDRKRSAHSDRLDDRGVVEFSDLVPGRWLLRTIIEYSGQAQPIDAGDVTLAAGEIRELAPEVEPLIFRGRIVGPETFARWSIAIADPPGWDAIRRRIQVDADGTFVAILPRRGTYDVSAHAGDPNATGMDIGEIAFDDPNRLIEIVMPQTSIVVEVRDEATPAAGAAVTLTLRRESPERGISEISRRMETDAMGLARFSMLPVGRWVARARSKDGKVAERIASVARDGEARVELDLSAAFAIEGIIRHAGGRPAGRATMECVYPAAAGPIVQRVAADGEGRFRLELASQPSLLRCGVTSREGIVAAHLLRPAPVLDFTLPPDGASLVLTDWFERVPRNDLWLLSPDGRLVGVMAMAGTIGQLGAPVVIRQFPPGPWKVVRTKTVEELAMLANGSSGTAEVIADLRLEAGRPAKVDLWKSAAGERRR